MQIEIDYRKPLELLKYPHPILSMKCAEVVDFNDDLQYFCRQMFVFMKTQLKWGKPVGLAAPQVGLPVRIFIAEDVLYINPVMTWHTKKPADTCHEGCYSLDTERFDYPAERWQSIMLKWRDHTGKECDGRFNGFHAQVIQHELDHLG